MSPHGRSQGREGKGGQDLAPSPSTVLPPSPSTAMCPPLLSPNRQRLEETTVKLQETAEALEAERERTDELLNSMLPSKVVQQLKSGERVHDEFKEVTIVLFSDVVSFTEIAADCTPDQIVDLLNALYTRFDAQTEMNLVYKVETIGDAYMVVCGAPDPDPFHAQRVAAQAFGMIQESQQVTNPSTGKSIQIRVGIHSGPVVAGVVGLKSPRYCLFGDTVNTASRMESHGLPGKIHISPSTFKHLKGKRGYRFQDRGESLIKGKGLMHTYLMFQAADGKGEVVPDGVMDAEDGHLIGSKALLNNFNQRTMRTNPTRKKHLPLSMLGSCMPDSCSCCFPRSMTQAALCSEGLASRFRGCMLGALLGDCLGAAFEGDKTVSVRVCSNYFAGLKDTAKSRRLPFKPYTDDTAMAKRVALSLLAGDGFDGPHMAREFVSEYFADGRRGYGWSVIDVFAKLRELISTDDSSPVDVYQPAREQFNGNGSYGNGAAMRAAPVALFSHGLPEEKMVEWAEGQARLTHSHPLGVNGAVLQCLAVREALFLSPLEKTDAEKFIGALRRRMEALEGRREEGTVKAAERDDMSSDSDEESGQFEVDRSKTFHEKLGVLESLLKKSESSDVDRAEVVARLGNDVTAIRSVVTGIFCYLRSQHPTALLPESSDATSPVERTVRLAICLGGDTDTIATMGAAISGAHFGESAIPVQLLSHCEAETEIRTLADRLCTAVSRRKTAAEVISSPSTPSGETMDLLHRLYDLSVDREERSDRPKEIVKPDRRLKAVISNEHEDSLDETPSQKAFMSALFAALEPPPKSERNSGNGAPFQSTKTCRPSFDLLGADDVFSSDVPGPSVSKSVPQSSGRPCSEKFSTRPFLSHSRIPRNQLPASRQNDCLRQQPQSEPRPFKKMKMDSSRPPFALPRARQEEESKENDQGAATGPGGMKSDFKTAKEKLVIDLAKKNVGNRGASLSSYGQSTCRFLGQRRPVNARFVPPVPRADQEGRGEARGSGMLERSSMPEGSRPAGSEEEDVDPRLRNVDPKMVELIENEIMDCSEPVSWDDIAGLDFAKTTIQEMVVLPMLRPDIFKGLRGPPKGLLLFGPPGTGKTLIGEKTRDVEGEAEIVGGSGNNRKAQLPLSVGPGKCLASQSRSTFFSISASSLTSKWVGEGEKMVRALFAVARQVLSSSPFPTAAEFCLREVRQPSVIFIDEVDSLLTARSDTEHESTRRLKTEFLVQLDGAGTSSEDRVLVVGATNRPQELDEAARRRFVKRLFIPLPEEEPHSLGEVDVRRMAQKTSGYSGADVTNLCREAALGPIRQLPFHVLETIQASQVPAISVEDFEAALATVKPSVSEKDLVGYVSWNETFGTTLAPPRSKC
ncbi:unnamed protein product [Cyprideis torosa]|uniref:ADP-ribosylhydrolase ARH3 n=1 Tax=Cyprideis torosa TaxID=163714 RepID=A0A7R8WA90_9CRUS|nr:unnamed protein product [Cyprideis torosa]CAG0885214.1 unnamed protein product [Cyprideis torosa]